jgi:hypothetical protein
MWHARSLVEDFEGDVESFGSILLKSKDSQGILH